MLAMAPGNGAAVTAEAVASATTTASTPAVATSPATSATVDAQHEGSTTRPPVRGVLPQIDTTTQNTIARQIDQALRVDRSTETQSQGDPRPAQINAATSVAVAAAPITDVPAAAAPVDAAPTQIGDVAVAERSVWQSVSIPTAQVTDTDLQAQLLTRATVDDAAVKPSPAVVETDPAQIVLRALDELSVPVMQTVTNANVRRPGSQNSTGRGASTSPRMDAIARQSTQAPPAVLENVTGPVAPTASEPVATMTTTVAPDQLRVTGTVADAMTPLTNDAVLPEPSLATASQSRFAALSSSVADDIDVASAPEASGGQSSSGTLTQSIASQVAGTVGSRIADPAVSGQVATGGTQTADSGSEVTVQRSTQGAPTTAAGGTEVQESVTIELSPPELGRVRIAFELRGTEARVNVNAEYAATASHLDQGFRALQSQFEDMGIRLTHLAVSCDASSDFQQGPSQHGQAGHDQPSPTSPLPIAWHESETGDSESADPGTQRGRQAARVTSDADSPESTGRAAVIDLMG